MEWNIDTVPKCEKGTTSDEVVAWRKLPKPYESRKESV